MCLCSYYESSLLGIKTLLVSFLFVSGDEGGPPLSNKDVKNLVILTELPFVVPFQERVKVSFL